MTRVTRGNHPKDDGSISSDHHKHECQVISEHLRNHVHLTNCIHLRNHMHRQSPVLAERDLMRDLIVLQRSRSLRDPSTSPPSWISPSIVGTLARRPARDGSVNSGRRSVGADPQREIVRLSTSSLHAASLAASKVAAAAQSKNKHDNGVRANVREISKAEEAARKNRESSTMACSVDTSKSSMSQKMEAKNKKSSRKGSEAFDFRLKSLSEQLEEIPSQAENESRNMSYFSEHTRHAREEVIQEELDGSVRAKGSGLNRVKRRKLKGKRKGRGPKEKKRDGAQNNLSVTSNSFALGSLNQNCNKDEGGEEDVDMEGSQAPRNGCGIPWNWSRIHHRGRTFIDMAGRSLSCGRSDSRLRKSEGSAHQGQGDSSNIPIMSDQLSSSANSDSEALPLLVEPAGSQESMENPFLTQDYSGELGIFADQGVRNERDSDIVSEARSDNHQTSRGYLNGRHRSLTQKYMPRTFKDLVGQNLVVQALSNAAFRRKVGSVYVFYGPHGTGKTSCARVFAKGLNCFSVEQPKPCDVCTSCISHNLGKSQNVLEVGPVGNFSFEGIMDLLDGVMFSPLSSQYSVFIVDDCDTLTADSWSAISKVIDRAPRHMVVVLVSENLDHLPHIILSRCQKFFFPKLRDSDIIYTLQWIATSEGLEIDRDALKLIASLSDGSLRDAEMTLDQLSLLGQRISLPLVQELVGLVSDEKLVDLLDLALSADTVNTVKRLREIMEAGVEPLALMSQLATIITDILAGSYIFTRERKRRKFFRRETLSKEDMEKLRQALKTLSEAEKQLRLSNDKLTWLTAALLQLAPDHQYMLPSSSSETSLNQSPVVLNNINAGDASRNHGGAWIEIPNGDRGLFRGMGRENIGPGTVNDVMHGNGKVRNHMNGKRLIGAAHPHAISAEAANVGLHGHGKNQMDNEKIWHAVLDNIHVRKLKEFMSEEGKLISVTLGTAPTVELMFSSLATKTKAEKFRGHILQAFESVLCSPVILELRCESQKDVRQGRNVLPPEIGMSEMTTKQGYVTNQKSISSGTGNSIRMLPNNRIVRGFGSSQTGLSFYVPAEKGKGEIDEILPSHKELEHVELSDNSATIDGKESENRWPGEASYQRQSSLVSLSEMDGKEQPQRQSLVRSKVSLAHVIQKAEGCAQRGGWSQRKAISIAEKLEQENLWLEPRSRTLLCWKASRVARGKVRTHVDRREETVGREDTRKTIPPTSVCCSDCIGAQAIFGILSSHKIVATTQLTETKPSQTNSSCRGAAKLKSVEEGCDCHLMLIESQSEVVGVRSCDTGQWSSVDRLNSPRFLMTNETR